MNKIEIPLGTLNSEDYEIFMDSCEEETEEAGNDIKESKLKAKNVLLITYSSDILYFEGFDFYDFNGSQFFVVDKDKKIAFFAAEPRQYTQKEFEEEQEDVFSMIGGFLENFSDATHEECEQHFSSIVEKIAKYNPKLIVLSE